MGSIKLFILSAVSISAFLLQTGCSTLFVDSNSSLTYEKLDERFHKFTLQEKLSYLDNALNSTLDFLPINGSAHRMMLEILNKNVSSSINSLQSSSPAVLQTQGWIPLNQTESTYAKFISLTSFFAVYKESLSYLNKMTLVDSISFQASLRISVIEEIFQSLDSEMSNYPVLFSSSLVDSIVTKSRIATAQQLKIIAEQNIYTSNHLKKDEIVIKDFQIALARYFNPPDQKAGWTTHQLINSGSFSNAQSLAFKMGRLDSDEIDGFEDSIDPIIRSQASIVLIKYLLLKLPNERRPATDESEDELAEGSAAQDAAQNQKVPVKVYPNTIIVGLTSGQVIRKNKNQLFLVAIEVVNRVIKSISEVTPADVSRLRAQNPRKLFIELSSSTAAVKTLDMYDVIYPGLINLHNHTKQNVLPVWSEARGQFENRFEWRDWNIYKLSVSKNMNPWIGFGPAITCAAFRLSEMQGIIGGVTYQQGFSTADATPCVDGFGVHRVEDVNAFTVKKEAVRAPTDLISPSDFAYVWEVLRPIILSGKTYEVALAQEINRNCPNLKITSANVNLPEGLKILQDRTVLAANCVEPLHRRFLRYINWSHPTVASAKRTLQSPNRSAYIVHLGEGRRLDMYNRAEFEMIKLLGLDLPNMNFVHGVGLDPEDFVTMGRKGMGLVWSPFSNLLLYNETLNIKAAHANRVPIALGTDWVPTGTKNLLEELRVAKNYVDADPEGEGLKSIFTDEVLYQMVTENPARIINQWAPNSGVGKIAVGTMGSFLVLKRNHANPFTNLVANSSEKDVNLVIVDGELIYGNRSYFQQAGITAFEVLSSEIGNSDQAGRDGTIPTLPETGQTPALKLQHLNTLGSLAAKYPFTLKDDCKFVEPKVFVTQNTLAFRPTYKAFFQATNINLDRFSDVQKLLALVAPSQGLNRTDGVASNDRFALQALPSLYSCNNTSHGVRFNSMIGSDNTNFEFSNNRNRRAALRNELKLGKSIEEMNRIYTH